MSVSKIGLAAATVAAGGAIVFGAAALANAATGTSASSTADAAPGYREDGPRGSADTPVTGAELAKVTAAVKAKDSAVTVSSVRKDPDGSYDVFGTRSGAQVMFEVSADLNTVAQNTGGPGAGGSPQSAPGGPTA